MLCLLFSTLRKRALTATLLLAAPSLADLRPRSGAARAAADGEAATAAAAAAAAAIDVPPRATEDFSGAALQTKSKIAAQVRAAMRASGALPERWP